MDPEALVNEILELRDELRELPDDDPDREGLRDREAELDAALAEWYSRGGFVPSNNYLLYW